MLEWELVEGGPGTGNASGVTERIVVPGGWLYRSAWSARYNRFGRQDASGLAFVPGDSGDGAAVEVAVVEEAAPVGVVEVPPVDPAEPFAVTALSIAQYNANVRAEPAPDAPAESVEVPADEPTPAADPVQTVPQIDAVAPEPEQEPEPSEVV